MMWPTMTREQTMTKIVLDTGSVTDISDELYDMLLDAFMAKARTMGVSDPQSPVMLLDNWRIECELKLIE